VLTLHLAGTLTLDAGRALLARGGSWLGPGRDTIIVDLTETSTVGDPGVWLLLRLAARCHAAGSSLLVAANDRWQARLPLRVVSPADARHAADRRRAESAPPCLQARPGG
jgi:ABC-type transporter Mla MlaB component